MAKGGVSAEAAARGKRTVYFSGFGSVESQTYDRALLTAGNRIEGPALIRRARLYDGVWPQDKVEVDAFGNLHIEIGRA